MGRAAIRKRLQARTTRRCLKQWRHKVGSYARAHYWWYGIELCLDKSCPGFINVFKSPDNQPGACPLTCDTCGTYFG